MYVLINDKMVSSNIAQMHGGCHFLLQWVEASMFLSLEPKYLEAVMFNSFKLRGNVASVASLLKA